jgi:hypothetical protein
MDIRQLTILLVLAAKAVSRNIFLTLFNHIRRIQPISAELTDSPGQEEATMFADVWLLAIDSQMEALHPCEEIPHGNSRCRIIYTSWLGGNRYEAFHRNVICTLIDDDGECAVAGQSSG